MSLVRHFAQSYAEAREKFVNAANACGARQFRHVHPSERGAEGEELSMDFAFVGNPGARGLLLLISATHGVEGFCGSGCQVALLHDDDFLRTVERSRVEVLMLHALNPYGFSHLRRVNEDNADLNRNFLDFSAPLPVNSAYAEIHSLLLPPAWPPPADNEAKLGAWIAANGERAYQAAVSGGQYQFADGMFYGGAAPAWSNLALHAVLREHAATRERLGWIDFHTGLGPRGHGEKIYAGVDSATDIARTRSWWGADVTSFFDGSSTSAPSTGINGATARDECPNVDFAGIALEYGTYPLDEVLQSFRAEHWLHNHPEAPIEQHKKIKRHLRDVFYVDADDWKQMVCTQAHDACMKAVAQLNSSHAHA